MYHKRDPTYRDFIRMSFNAHYRFRIVSGIQIYEKKYQAKHNIVSCSRINTLSDISSTADSIISHLEKSNRL